MCHEKKSSGAMKVSKVIDVFRNTGYGNLGYSEGYKFVNKYNKKQLIAKQNNSFSTSMNTTNCYKETNMGFSTALPKPYGMGTWQSYENNINKVLSALGVGSVNNMNYGDKVIVEPLYDMRLQSIYHSITVTEIALYGKYILGSSSDGGTSSTPASWGFISNYTNKNYPNELFTPDGQGLWSGVSALGSRATFYNIINKGYGVGIAYNETRNQNYTIKFYGNGATGGSTATMTMTYGTAKNLTANGFYCTGCKYVNWNTKADGSGTSYSNQQSVKNLTTGGGTISLYARWTPNKLTVTYNANGGSLDSSSYYLSSGNIYANSTREPASLIWTYNVAKANGLHNASTFGLYKTGYTFNQWQTSASGGKVFDQNDSTLKPTDLNSNIEDFTPVYLKLYARWKPNTYNIVFNGNGSTGGSTDSMSMTYDTAKSLTANGFAKPGFHFSCWTTNKDGSGNVYYDQQSVRNLTSVNGATITLYAQWSVNSYTIGFNGNGATSGNTSSMVMRFNYAKNLNANGYSRTGYTFKNWNTKADGSGTSYTNKQSVTNLTATDGATVYLYARWTPNYYNIYFNGNGATGGSTASMQMAL